MSYDPATEIIPSQGSTGERDVCSREGAQLLAQRLDDWWHTRGFTQVQHWVERSAGRSRSHRKKAELPPPSIKDEPEGVWVVRSNLINGLPPRRHAPDA